MRRGGVTCKQSKVTRLGLGGFWHGAAARGRSWVVNPVKSKAMASPSDSSGERHPWRDDFELTSGSGGGIMDVAAIKPSASSCSVMSGAEGLERPRMPPLLGSNPVT